MTFIPPKYKCDNCGAEAEAENNIYNQWDPPYGWAIVGRFKFCEQHYCDKCPKDKGGR